MRNTREATYIYILWSRAEKNERLGWRLEITPCPCIWTINRLTECICFSLCLLHNSLLALRMAGTQLDFAFAHERIFSVQTWEWSYLLQWNTPNHWLPIKVHTTQQHQHAVSWYNYNERYQPNQSSNCKIIYQSMYLCIAMQAF